MTPNELRMMNLKLEVKTVKTLMELYQQQNYGQTTIFELLRLAAPKIDNKEEKLGLLKKCAAVRQVWNISELAAKLDVSPQTIDVSSSSQDVKISVRVTDASGVNDSILPEVHVYNPDNRNGTIVSKRVSLESGTIKDGVYSATLTVPQGKMPGEWTVYCGYFYDLYDNCKSTLTYSQTKLTVINN